MSHKGLKAIEELEKLAFYLLKCFPDEIEDGSAVEVAIRLLDKLREVLIMVHMEKLRELA